MAKIQEILLIGRITKPIDKQQRHLNPNKQQILRNLKHSAHNTIIINLHPNNIDKFNNINTDKYNRSNDLMLSKNTNKQYHNKISSKSYKYIIIIFYFTFTYCLDFFVIYVLVFVQEI
jgi:hypothetical protein